MAIYGLNFNGLQFPDTAPRFAERLKQREDGTVYAVGSDKGCDFILQGLCQTGAEKDQMLIQANNGHRRFHVVRRRGWYAIYCG